MGIKRPAAKSGGSKAVVKRNMGGAARNWSEQPWTNPARMVISPWMQARGISLQFGLSEMYAKGNKGQSSHGKRVTSFGWKIKTQRTIFNCPALNYWLQQTRLIKPRKGQSKSHRTKSKMQILGNAPLPPPKKDGLEYALIIRNQTYDHKAKTASNNEPA